MNADILYIECDVPDGETLREWRRRQSDHHSRRRTRRVIRKLRTVLP